MKKFQMHQKTLPTVKQKLKNIEPEIDKLKASVATREVTVKDLNQKNCRS